LRTLHSALLGMVLATLGAKAAAPPTELWGRLPLRFEKHPGRDGVEYVARTSGFVLRLAPFKSWLELKHPATGEVARVNTTMISSNPRTEMQPEARLAGAANYFVGASKDWQTEITGFGRIRYKNIYPGIDLVFHGERGRLEYDFILAPHADPHRIRFELSGQSALRVDEKGDLIIGTNAGEIRWAKPVIYQEIHGKRTTVTGQFRLAGKRIVEFHLVAYDKRQTLVIDPTLVYSTYLGGTGNEVARGIALDGAGNVYISGTTSTSNLPTISAFQPNFGGLTASRVTGDGFVAKFDSSGKLLYLTYIGGSGDDGVAAISVDTSGNAYITGATNSQDFPTVNAFQNQLGGAGGNAMLRTGDAFVAKLNPAGNKLIYSTYLGGTMDDIGLAIAVDSGGNAYITGATQSTNFPLSQGAYQTRLKGVGGEPILPCCNAAVWDPGDAFVAKLDPTGSQMIFSTYLGGSQDEAAFTIGLDSSNNVYVAGCTISFDFPTTSGAFKRTWGGVDVQNPFVNFGDGFVTKLNPTGTGLVYSTFFGGAGDDCVSAIAVDPAGNVYMAGSTSTQNLATSTGALQPSYAGYQALPLDVEQLYGDAFVAKLNPAGSALVYLTYLGGGKNDGASAIAIDTSGDAYVTGFTDSADFPVAGSSPLQPKLAGAGGHGPYKPYGDAFLALVNPAGTALLYSTFLGGSLDDGSGGVAIDGNGKVYVAGNTLSANFPTTAGAFQTSYGGTSLPLVDGAAKGDAFYSVLSGFPLAPPQISSVANAFGNSSTIAPNTWIAIKGTGLAPDSRIWQGSDFVNNQMPTSLDGVSVTMNGKNAFVYYISSTQLNVLSRPDLAAGPVQIQVTVNGISSAPFTIQAQPVSISFFVFNGGPYIIATHLDGTLIGPPSLFPGLTTPAAPNEEIVVYANGFGQTTVPIVPGSPTQSGSLPGFPPLQIGGVVANLKFSGLISPGLFQFNVVVPATVQNGDNAIQSEFGGQITQSGTLVTIQK
jgi:uncharacterized protein (TIGR03437 family)